VDESPLRIVRDPIRRADLSLLASGQLGDMVKAVVDIGRGIMAIGGELQSDEEAVLLDDGSRHSDLWGINLYVAEPASDWIEYDSVINLRPAQGNRSRGVDDPGVREEICRIVDSLVVET
jgi:hypothetical protein